MLEMKVNEMTMIKAKSLIVDDQYLDDHDSDSVGDSGRSRPSDEGGRGGGWWSSRPWDKGGSLQKIYFGLSALSLV